MNDILVQGGLPAAQRWKRFRQRSTVNGQDYFSYTASKLLFVPESVADDENE